MKIAGIVDVITNSSSETFMIKSEGMSREEVQNLLEELGDLGCSGMGGELTVLDNKSHSEYFPGLDNLPDNIFLIDVDLAKKSVLKFIIDCLFIIDTPEDYKCTRDPKTGRIISLWEDDDKETSGQYYHKIYRGTFENLISYFEGLSWKSGKKILFRDYMDLIDYYSSSNGYSDYNLDISPVDNLRIWDKEEKEKKQEILCKFGL